MPLPDGIHFADLGRAIERHANKLPHWQQPQAAYFVTFRLADSLPRDLLDGWKAERSAWLEHHPEPWALQVEKEYHERFSRSIDRWLDAGHGECLFRDPLLASIVAGVLETFGEGQRYTHHSWIIMPNHVHALFSVEPGQQLEDILKSWKGVSARRLNQHLSRGGELWMEDYFDRLIRDEAHFWNAARYIRQTP